MTPPRDARFPGIMLCTCSRRCATSQNAGLTKSSQPSVSISVARDARAHCPRADPLESIQSAASLPSPLVHRLYITAMLTRSFRLSPLVHTHDCTDPSIFNGGPLSYTLPASVGSAVCSRCVHAPPTLPSGPSCPFRSPRDPPHEPDCLPKCHVGRSGDRPRCSGPLPSLI